MKILVCVKQVPDSSDTLAIDEQTGRIVFKPSTVFRMNRYDELPWKRPFLLRKSFQGPRSMRYLSVPSVPALLFRRALEMGADHGIHILFTPEIYVSPFITASFIASYARNRDYDLIIAGVMAEDDMACQTGQLIAALLDLPYATSVISTEFQPEKGVVNVDREIEGGRRLSVQLQMPAVLTIQSGINTPRYPSLSNVMRARTQQQEVITAEDFSLPEMREACIGLRLPDPVSMGAFIEGSSREKARKLLQVLHEKKFLS